MVHSLFFLQAVHATEPVCPVPAKIQHISLPFGNEVMQQNGYDRYEDVLDLQKVSAAVPVPVIPILLHDFVAEGQAHVHELDNHISRVVSGRRNGIL